MIAGPYLPPADIREPGKLEEFRQYIENEMFELTHHAQTVIEGESAPRTGFPEGWTPQWKEPVLIRPLEAVSWPKASQSAVALGEEDADTRR